MSNLNVVWELWFRSNQAPLLWASSDLRAHPFDTTGRQLRWQFGFTSHGGIAIVAPTTHPACQGFRQDLIRRHISTSARESTRAALAALLSCHLHTRLRAHHSIQLFFKELSTLLISFTNLSATIIVTGDISICLQATRVIHRADNSTNYQ